MNRNRAGGGDDDFAAVGEEPTFAARYAGTCATCRQRFAVGDPIASVVVDTKTTYHHGTCRYPATAFLARTLGGAEVVAGAGAEAEVDVDAGTRPRPGGCGATTKRGTPCGNAPQKGEQFCGPHPTQRIAGTGPNAEGSADRDR